MHKEPREGLHYGVFEVAAGWVGILASPAGIRRLSLSQESPADAIERLTGGRDGWAAESHFPDLEARLERYFRGEDTPYSTTSWTSWGRNSRRGRGRPQELYRAERRGATAG